MSNGGHPLPAADDLSAQGLQDRPGRWLRDLFAPLDHLLVAGGDNRLALVPATRMNAYFCRPLPCPDSLEFSSSTATSISLRGYEAAGRARGALMQAAIRDGIEDAFDARIDAMRSELRGVLGLASDVDVVFSASGTDAQLQALYLGRALLGASPTTLVVAADQTGSGTVFTARGQHFGERTANDHKVTKGTRLDGLAQPVECIALSLRNDVGEIRCEAETDALVLQAVDRLVSRGDRVLLQAMDCSKLGWRAPSDALLRDIAKRWPHQVQVVIDACQMRLSRRRIARYLDDGFMVLLTGSKYFTGPPFCGALLLPPTITRRLAATEFDLGGLDAYNSTSDWPRAWRTARAQLPAKPNFGQWLRWETALDEITAYYAVPDEFRHRALSVLGDGIARMIAASPHLRLLPLPPIGDVEFDDEMALPTIFGFTLTRRGATLSLDNCKAIHRALAQTSNDVRDGLFASLACILGQPVEWRDAHGQSVAALRLCISARHVTDSWSADPAVAQTNLSRLLDQVAIAIIQIETLLQQPETATSEVPHGHSAH
uniref:Uncharacterized protein n=1 Tax=Rhodopseudomonas palustris (strain BisA53) TaxID=316055 RepID=Q07H30_RHOP5